MGVIIAEDSELAKELAKWNKPYVHQPFPRMVYMAFPRENGKVECGDAAVAWGDPVAEAFTRRCQREVRDERDLAAAKGQGWIEGGPDKAIQAYERRQQEIATAAAEANYAAQRMTPKAQAERKARDAATANQVPE